MRRKVGGSVGDAVEGGTVGVCVGVNDGVTVGLRLGVWVLAAGRHTAAYMCGEDIDLVGRHLTVNPQDEVFESYSHPPKTPEPTLGRFSHIC